MIKKMKIKLFSLIKNITILLKNIRYINLFIKDVLINKKNIFQVRSTVIGHFPISMFFSKQLFGNNSIYFFKSGVSNTNHFLEKKIKEFFTFDQKYAGVYEIMHAIKKLTFGIYNFKEFPEHMHMTENINFSHAYDGKSKLFEFNTSENKNGENFLNKMNINKKKFICFLVRTNEYNKVYGTIRQSKREDKIRKFLNVNPKAYLPSLEYLVNSGYIVIRMGKGFNNPFPFRHKNFIDYAISPYRSDFLDIWLSANCMFFFGTNTGINTLPSVFNKPFLGTNAFPVGIIASYTPNSIHLPRLAKKNGKLLNIKEHIRLDVIRQVNGVHYENIGLEAIENDPEDILNAVKDIENKIKNGFFVNDLNMQFWKKLKKYWSTNLVSNSSLGKRSFDYFHKINGINTSIPDFYLKKYKDIFIDY